MRNLTILALFISLIFVGLNPVSAGGPLFWRVNTFAEVEKGEVKGLSIDANGAVTLAPALTEVFDTKQAYIWSAVTDRAGNVFLGTGNEGRVFKIDPSGKGTLLYQTSELSVMALAVDTQGNVYAGSSPDGKVYRIAPNGEAKVFFEPKAKYIWSLAFDAQGRLLVGTGDKGILYRVTPDGTGTPLVTASQANLTTLRIDPAGNILAGTDPGGAILRITPEGKAFTLFDSAQREIRDLALGRDGTIYALALAESAGSGATNTAPAASAATPNVATPLEGGVTVTISDVQVLDAGGAAQTASGSSSTNQAKSVLYQITGAGAWQPIWESRDAAAFAASIQDDGSLLVGTGQKGRLYRIRPNQPASLLAQLSEAQTSRFIHAGGKLFVATSNLGKLFAINPDSTAEGTLTSAVCDTQNHSTWGRLNWAGEGTIELQTRSGNTSAPDATWSDWSAPIASADGETIKSPAARYLQWRATLKRPAAGAPPRLREVIVSYLPRNLAPRLTSLSVLPAGVSLQPIPQAAMDGVAEALQAEAAAVTSIMAMPPRRVFQRGAISLQWQAEDRNSDQLEFSVFYRLAAGGEYYPLKKAIRDSYFTIDSNELPDGRYVFKIQASDRISNPAELALIHEQETEPVEIDNTPPQVTAETPKIVGDQVEIGYRATDSTSIIRRAEYQLDGGPWRAIFPVDGMADSKQEEFRLKLTLPDARPHTLAIRVFDANANIGAAQSSVGGR